MQSDQKGKFEKQVAQPLPAVSRKRTFEWEDPAIGATAARSMTGIGYLQAISEGTLPVPPIMSTLGLDQKPEVEAGKATFFLEPQEYHYNPIGSVHGGVIATLLDSAMACAVQSTLPTGVAYTTLELKVNYVRAVTAENGRLRCEGTVLSKGRRVATAEGRMVDASGKLYAHATTTCLILTSEQM